MSRLMNADQHNQLMLLRGHLCAAVVSGDHDATQSATGRVQGITFLMNARKVVHAN